MIEIGNISKSFDGAPFLKGVNLRVERNSTVALMGSSGSGKTVLLKIITGLIPPDSGRVLIDGAEITGAARRDLDKIRENIGMIFQGSALFDSLTVEENIGFALERMLNLDEALIRKRVREAMDQVKLGPIEDLYPSQISGGMKKRVGIARAIVVHPKVLLADEPTAGLDPATSRAIVKVLRDIVKNFKMTCLLVTSSLETASMLAEKVAFLHGGKIGDLIAPDEMRASSDENIRRFAMTSGFKNGNGNEERGN